MTPLVWSLTVDYTQALQQVNAFIAKASELSRAAKPVQVTVDTSGYERAQQTVETASARAAAASERASAREQAAADRAAKAAEAAAAREIAAQERKAKAAERATVQLQQMAAVTPKQQALAAYEAEIAAIKRLEIESGNARLAEEARAAAQTRLNQRLATQSGQATASIGAQRAAVDQFGMQLSDVASQLSTGTSPFTILIQQGPQVQQALQMGGGAANLLKGALAALNPAVVLLGASVVALGTAYYAANRETQRTLDQRQFEHEVTLSLIPGIRKLEDAKIKEAVATGVLTESEGALSTARLTAQRAVLDYAEAQKKQKDGINEQIASAEKWLSLQHQLIRAGVALIDVTVMAGNTVSRIAKGETLAHVIESDTTAIDGLMNSVTGLSDTVDDGKAKLQALSDAEIENAKNAKAAAEADAKAAAAKASHAKSAKDLDDWLRRINQAMQEENGLAEANEKAYNAAINGIDDVADAAKQRARREKTASEQIVADYEAQIQKIRQLKREAQNASVGPASDDAAKKAADAEYDAEKAMRARLSELRANAALEGLALQNKTAAEQAEILKKGEKDQKEAAASLRNDMANLATQYSGLLNSLLSQNLNAETEAANKAYEKVGRLQDLMKDLSTETVDAAGLSGKALVKAYKTGKVAADDLSESQRQRLEKTLEEEEKAAKKQAAMHKEAAMNSWRVTQALSLATAIVQGSVAVVNALATPPLNPFVVAATVAATGVEVATIASAKPPSFRAGGVISDAAPSAGASLPDVRMIAAELGESINTRRGTQNLGGEEGVRRNNAGMPIQPPTFILKYGHQVMDRGVSDLLKRPSKTRSLLARNHISTNPYIGRG